MKFAFDCDGVITDQPEFYSAITKALKASGHIIYIVTDFDEHWREDRVRELKRYGIEYDELIITGEKQKFCEENGIDYAIDDHSSYYPDYKGHIAGLFPIKSR